MSGIVRPARPSALPPTEAELAAWQGLPREEQIARFREVLLAPEARRVSAASMADVLSPHGRVLRIGETEFRLSIRAECDLIEIYDYT